jgi:hypothetical protein
MSRGKQYTDALVCQYENGAAITASTTETRLQAATAHCTLAPNYFDQLGKTIEIVMRGRITTVVTTPGTLTLRVKLGSTVTTGTGAIAGGVSVWDSGAIALNVVAKTNVTWGLNLLLTSFVLGDGALAKLMGVGQICSEALVGATAGQPLDFWLPASAPVVGTGFDSTASQSLNISSQWSISNADSIQSHLYTVRALN